MHDEYDARDYASGEIPDFWGGNAAPIGEADTELDTLETSEHVPLKCGYRSFLTSGMSKQIDQGDRLYQAIDKLDNKHKVFLYRTCHTTAAFLRHRETGHIKIGSNSCKLRFCPLCQRTKKNIITENTTQWLQGKKKPKFITLTLKHSDTPLKEQIDRLYAAFKELRRKPLWKKKIRGGIWFFQVKKSKENNLWHPHLHICCHGDYIDKFELSCIWKGITNDSQIVDVKKIEKADTAAKYVGRYAAAACEPATLSDDEFLQLALAMSGRRICGTFGSAKGLQLSIQPPTDKEEWQHIGNFSDIFEAKDYEPFAAQIWNCWKTNQPMIEAPPAPAEQIKHNFLEQAIKTKKEQLLLFGK